MKRQAALILTLCAAIAALCAFDLSMERLQTKEVHRDAERSYILGVQLLKSGHSAQAAERFQKSYAAERYNSRYQLSLADALLNSGQLDEASALLNDAANDAPNDGKTNLLLARLARAQNRPADEAPYYHRAMYGTWREDARRHRNEVRLEWIRRLVQRGDHNLLLGELLPLEAESTDPQILKEVALDYLEAGSPVRSAGLYRMLLTTEPSNADLESGLADAEASAGNYTSAQTALLRALHANQGDSRVRQKMELISALAALDPTPRRLPSGEKYDRSTRVLKLVRDTLLGCGEQSTATDGALNVKHPDVTNESAEQLLELAERLWKTRPPKCAPPELVSVLMRKLSQIR